MSLCRLLELRVRICHQFAAGTVNTFSVITDKIYPTDFGITHQLITNFACIIRFGLYCCVLIQKPLVIINQVLFLDIGFKFFLLTVDNQFQVLLHHIHSLLSRFFVTIHDRRGRFLIRGNTQHYNTANRNQKGQDKLHPDTAVKWDITFLPFSPFLPARFFFYAPLYWLFLFHAFLQRVFLVHFFHT